MCGFVGFTNCIDDSNKALENMMNRIIHRALIPEAAILTAILLWVSGGSVL